MAKVVLSPEALEDIKSIHDYIAKDSIDRASIFIERLIETAYSLEEFPKRGRVIEEIGSDQPSFCYS